MSKEKYFLCIDNGLSLGKVAIVDFNGRIVETSSFKTDIINEKDFSELDMNLLWLKTLDAIKEVIEKSGIDPLRVMSVGNSAHGGGLYLIDKYGNPVRNAITSMDSRASGLIDKWEKEGVDGYSKTYAHMWNGQAIPLLYWLKENENDIYKKINKVLFCKDWIKFKLTGKAFTDYTDASNSGLINLDIKDYDLELYKLYELDDLYEKLPTLSKSEDIMGYISETAAKQTGLPEGTPVIGGCIDVVACILGSGIYDESAFSIISGTWNINSAISSEINKSPDVMYSIIFADPEKYMVMDVSPTSAVNLEWFLTEILEKMGACSLTRKQIYKKIDEEILKLNPEDVEVFYFPFLYKSKLSKKMEGAFIGFNASNNIYHLIYSIYEGVVFAHLLHLDNLRKGGMNRNHAVISGGASNSPVWCQMFADILKIDILTTQSNEVGIQGLAICQSLGLKISDSIKNAVDKMVKVKSAFNPDFIKNEKFMKRYFEFKRIKMILDN